LSLGKVLKKLSFSPGKTSGEVINFLTGRAFYYSIAPFTGAREFFSIREKERLGVRESLGQGFERLKGRR
jgi:hypothetical protein